MVTSYFLIFLPVADSVNIKILNAGAWSRSSEKVFVSLPTELEDLIPEVEEFYKKNHSGRKLHWHHLMSNGIVSRWCVSSAVVLTESTRTLNMICLNERDLSLSHRSSVNRSTGSSPWSCRDVGFWLYQLGYCFCLQIQYDPLCGSFPAQQEGKDENVLLQEQLVEGSPSFPLASHWTELVT